MSQNDWYQWFAGGFESILIEDDGGIDTIHLANLAVAARVDMNWGGVSSIGGLSDNLRIAWGSTIENLNGTALGDTVLGNGAANALYTYGGDDTVDGGAGDDTLVAGSGRDNVAGGAGDDLIYGEAGADTLSGGAGRDFLIGGADGDSLDGGAGDDALWGEAGADTLNGGDGDDSLFGGGGDDALGGDAGDDDLLGEGGQDWIWGGAGDDQLNGGEGHDNLWGGAGADRFLYNGWSRWDTIHDFEQGIDRLVFWDATSFDDLSFRRWGDGVLIELGDTHLYVRDSRIDDWTVEDVELPQAPPPERLALATDAAAWAETQAFQSFAGSAVVSAGGVRRGDAQTLTVAGDAGGAFVFWASGGVQFNPDGDFADLAPGQTRTTQASFGYLDGAGVTRRAEVAAAVTGLNDAPVVAGPLTARTGENDVATLDALAGVTDPDPGQALTVSRVHAADGSVVALSGATAFDSWSGPGYGRFTLSPDGTLAFDPGTDFDWMVAGQSFAASLGYYVADGAGAETYRTVTVTVDGAPESGPPPAAVAATGPANGFATASLTNDEPGVRVIAAGGTDLVDATDGQEMITVHAETGGRFDVYEYGGVVFAADGDFRSLGAGASAQTAIAYATRDGAGTTVQGTLTVTVTGVNDNPTVDGPLTASTFENDAVAFDGLAGAADPDAGDALGITRVFLGGDPSNTVALDGATVTVDSWSGPGFGRFAFAPGGQITFTPGTDFDALRIGQVADVSIGWFIGDGQGGEVYQQGTVSVIGQFENGPPLLSARMTAREDSAAETNVANNEAGSAITRGGDVALEDATDGQEQISVDADAGGRFVFYEYGGIQFFADGDFEALGVGQSAATGTDYLVVDAADNTYSGRVDVTVTGVNDNPTVAAGLSATTGENAGVELSGLAGAADVDGDSLRIGTVHNAESTNVALTPGQAASFGSWQGLGTFTFQPNGVIAFDPGADFDYLRVGQHADVSIGFFVEDPHGGAVWQTVTVRVQGELEAPPPGAVEATAREDGFADANLTAGEPGSVIASAGGQALVDADPAANETLIVNPAGGGRFTFFEFGDVQFFADGDFEDLGVGETRVTTADYVVRDAAGGETAGTISVTVTGVNDNPTAVNVTKAAGENQSLSFNLLAEAQAADIDGDALAIESVFTSETEAVAPGGSITVEGWNGGAFTVHADGRVAFDPGDDFDRLNPGETAVTTLGFTVGDGEGGGVYRTMEVTLSGAEETYVSQTDWINAITLADDDVNRDGVEDWRQPIATVPTGGGLPAADFFDVTREELPLVNTIRFVLSPYTAEDPTAFAAFQGWMQAAADAGYWIHVVYADGTHVSNTKILPEDDQTGYLTRIEGEGDADDSVDVSDAYVTRMIAVWQSLLDWTAANPDVADNVWAWELLNEPEAYRTLMADGGYYITGADAARYAADMIALHDGVTGWGDTKIMVGGLSASSNFAALTQGRMSDGDARAPIEAIREAIGEPLIWSAHTYPGWGVANENVGDWIQYWKDKLWPIAGEHVMLTEGHGRDLYANEVTNGDASLSLDNAYLRALEWFGANGIGFSWWPAAFENSNLASQALMTVDGDNQVTRYENNIYWANRAWQVGRDGAGDPLAGDDNLAGAGADDFIYGDGGDDQLSGLGGDDTLEGGVGDDILYGGDGDDVLVGGAGRDNLTGGAGADAFIFRHDEGVDRITDFTPGTDTLTFVNIAYDRISFSQAGPHTEILVDGAVSVVLNDISYGAGDVSADFAQVLFGRVVEDQNGEATAVDDTIVGAAGDDRIHGGLGDDSLSGGPGDDRLNGGVGTDTLTGGAGADLFIVGGAAPGTGAALTTVADYVDGVDRIGIATPFVDFAALVITAQNGDARIAVPGAAGDVMIVQGAAGMLDAGDFVFGL